MVDQEKSLDGLLAQYGEHIKSADTKNPIKRAIRSVDTVMGIAFSPYAWVDPSERARVRAVSRLFWMDRPTELTRRLVSQIDLAAPASRP